VWLDSSNFQDQQARPKVRDGAWQAFIHDLEGDFGHSDFMLLDPHGDFFLRRIMQDDIRLPNSKDDPRLDVILMLYRVAEVFVVGLALAKALGWNAEGVAGFDIRWLGLRGRRLGAWARPLQWDVTGSGTAHDAEKESFTDVPLDTPAAAVGPYVANAVAPLFAAFDGFVVSDRLIEDCVRRLIERRME
jgi:hypothetical protein